MRLALLLLLAALLAPAAEAQAPRQVFLSLCNDAPFAAGVAATYPVDPSGRRMSRGWFRVEANSCLEGAIDGVVGRSMALHVRSGEWRWPPADGDATWCAPPYGFTQPAAAPDCEAGQEAAAYATVSVRDFRAGWGRVDYRFGCEAFGDEAALCAITPRARDGLAEPVRTLEVCNWSGETVWLADAVANPATDLIVSGWTEMARGACIEQFRGFLSDGRIYVHAQVGSADGMSGQFRTLCVGTSSFEHTVPSSELFETTTCPDEGQRVARFREVRFHPGVARFTLEIGGGPD